LGRYEQERARSRLRSLEILEEKLSGMPARMYYRVNFEALYRLLSQLDGGKIANTVDRNQPTSKTDVSHPYKETKNTQQTKQKIKNQDPPNPPSQRGTVKITSRDLRNLSLEMARLREASLGCLDLNEEDAIDICCERLCLPPDAVRA